MYDLLQNFLRALAPVTDEDFAVFRELLVVRKLKKKELLTRAGETEEYIYFIVSGLVHQYYMKGKETITTDLVPEGTICNAAVSFLSGKPSHYSLQAMEPCILLGLSKKRLEYLYGIDKRWQRMGRLLLTHFLLRQEKGIIDSLRLTMRERFLQFATEYPGLMKRVPQRRLASYLNIKPETFSRLKPLLKDA